MKTKILTALLLCTFLSGAAAVAAGNDAERHRDGDRSRHAMDGDRLFGMGARPESMLRHLNRELGLDDAQQQAVKEILSAAQLEIEAQHARTVEHGKALRALNPDDGNYSAELQNFADTAAQLASEKVMLHGRLLAELNEVLTPEQRQKLAERTGSRGERWRERRERAGKNSG
jgi:Spy/CpxP family protein refolding chaperone